MLTSNYSIAISGNTLWMKQSNVSNSDLVSSKTIRVHFDKPILLSKMILSTSKISRCNENGQFWIAILKFNYSQGLIWIFVENGYCLDCDIYRIAMTDSNLFWMVSLSQKRILSIESHSKLSNQSQLKP